MFNVPYPATYKLGSIVTPVCFDCVTVLEFVSLRNLHRLLLRKKPKEKIDNKGGGYVKPFDLIRGWEAIGILSMGRKRKYVKKVMNQWLLQIPVFLIISPVDFFKKEDYGKLGKQLSCPAMVSNSTVWGTNKISDLRPLITLHLACATKL